MITHTTMTTSLGLDVKTSCAAARGGLVRSHDSEYKLGSPSKGEIESATIHSLPIITKGFQGTARLKVILQTMLNNVLQQLLGLDSEIQLLLYFSLPHPYRIYRGVNLSSFEPDENLLELEEAIDNDVVDDGIYKPLLAEVIESLQWPTKLVVQNITYSGSNGVTECTALVNEDLQEIQSPTMAIVIGVDSLVSIKELTWLDATGRLKKSDNPVGVQPGEGGAAIVLCSNEVASRYKLSPLAFIKGIEVSKEKNSLIKAKRSAGKVITDILCNLIPLQPKDSCSLLWMISDHNGEEYRANEMGMILHRLEEQNNDLEIEHNIWLPAISFGHLDAAYGGIAICMVIEAFKRSYAPSSYVQVISSSDGVERGGILICFQSGKYNGR